MIKRIIAYGLFVLLTGLTVNAQGVSTANRNANPVAKSILSYLYTLPERADNRVISGQFGMYGDDETYELAQLSLKRVFDKTGQWPGITGGDYASEIGITEVNRYLIDKWNEGYLVNLSWHSPNPCTGGSAGDGELPGRTFDLRRVLSGGNCYNAWIKMLDEVAIGLQQLQTAGVTILWRPFHENNGVWFWWGGNARPDDFKQLWRQTFDYLTRTKGLNNLLWVFSPNFEWDSTAPDVILYYPGAEYVDIVGMDKYMNCTATNNDRTVTSYETVLDLDRSYNDLVSTGKPVALMEWGALPASGACWAANPYPYRMDYLIRDIKSRYPRIVLFQAWEWIFQLGREEFRGVEALMADSWVISRSELPNFRSGQVPTSVPTSIVSHTPTATSIPVTPTAIPSQQSSGLTWMPPVLENPTTVRLSSGVTRLDQNKDYILQIQNVITGSVAIVGGRNVVLIGGEIAIPNQGNNPSISSRTALKIKDATGVVHLEGLLLRGEDISEGIQIDAPNAIIQIQNVRIDNVHARDQVNFTDNHPDLIQPYGGFRELRIDRFTGSSDYQGIFLKCDANCPFGSVDIRRVNIVGLLPARYLFWIQPDSEWTQTVELNEVWITVPSQRSGGMSRAVWPHTQIDSQGCASWPTLSTPRVTGKVCSGSVADFVSAGSVGMNYNRPNSPQPTFAPTNTPVTVTATPTAQPTFAPTNTPSPITINGHGCFEERRRYVNGVLQSIELYSCER